MTTTVAAQDTQFRVVFLESVDSTNEEARRLAVGGAPSGTVVWAARQTAGRGRRGRTWVAPEGNFQCSVLLRLGCASALAAQVSLVAAVAAGEAVAASLAGRPGVVQLKWPNDVLIEGRKVAGLLLEAEPSDQGRLAWLVVGLGINLERCPEGTPYPATALAAEGGGGVSARAMLEIFLGRFGAWLECWQRAGFSPVRSAWLAQAVGLGRPVSVVLHHETLVGQFCGLDEDGALLLEPASGGTVRRIDAGDVYFPWLSGAAGNSAKA